MINHYLDKFCHDTNVEILMWYNTNTPIDHMLHQNLLKILDLLSIIDRVKIRILFGNENKIYIDKQVFSKIEYLYSNQVDRFNNIFFISDNRYILLLETYDTGEGNFSYLYSNNERMVLSYLMIFESNWNLALLKEQKV